MIPRPLGVDFSSSDMQFATVISFNKKPLFTNLPLLKKVIRYIFRKIEIKYIQEAWKRSDAWFKKCFSVVFTFKRLHTNKQFFFGGFPKFANVLLSVG